MRRTKTGTGTGTVTVTTESKTKTVTRTGAVEDRGSESRYKRSAMIGAVRAGTKEVQ